MNIFFLSTDPQQCAEYHCDKHVVKMIIEYAQLMSTAHRLLDGRQYTENNKGRMTKRWKLNDNIDTIIYKASHVNHPSAIWTRQDASHYTWLLTMWKFLLKEYTHRYGKHHKTGELEFALSRLPRNIPIKSLSIEEPPQAMPEECKANGAVNAYRQYYILKKNGFARWTNRQIPKWYSQGILDLLTMESQVMGLYD
jgi:hypothetical protein